MTISLFPDQQALKNDIYKAWWQDNYQNVLAVSPTRTGKSIIMASVVFDQQSAGCLIGHSTDILKNLSFALCKFDVQHQIIAPNKIIRHIVGAQVQKFNRRYHATTANVYVASVDTLRCRKDSLVEVMAQCLWWIQDEAHHIRGDNKWGKVLDLFPNAKKGLGFTATAERGDGLGLGREYGGVMDTMVVGESQLELIDKGRLCPYKIYAKESKIDLSQVTINPGGDFNAQKLEEAYHDAAAKGRAEIIGDAVNHYKKWGANGRMLAFTVSVKSAEELASRFKSAGVPAVALCGKSDIEYRHRVLTKLAKGEIKIVTSVEIFGEGVDVPELDGVILVRHTASFTVFNQQCGRPLTVSPGKKQGLILDCVGNVKRHAFTEEFKGKSVINISRPFWTLAGKTKKAKAERKILITECDNPACLQPYERFLPRCPWCGNRPEPIERATPQQVDGDLSLLEPSSLKKLTATAQKAHRSRDDIFTWASVQHGVNLAAHIADKHEKKRQYLNELNDSICLWAGYQRYLKREDVESYKRFYAEFGTDALTAQSLPSKDIQELNESIQRRITELGKQI